MSSLVRRIQRQRHKADRGGNPPLVRNVSEAGYEVLHPTKGWRRFSAKRARLLTVVVPA